MSTPAFFLNNSPRICCVSPVPGEPKFYLPGLAFSLVSNSGSVLTPIDGDTTRANDWAPKKQTGSNAVSGRKGNAGFRIGFRTRVEKLP